MNDLTGGSFTDETFAEKKTLVEPGMEAEFLDMLLKNLDVGIAILDEDMRYRLLSNASFSQLNLTDGEIKLGDSLSHMHDLMIKKGLLSKEIMAKNALSEVEHRNNIAQDENQSSRLVELGDGSKHQFCRQVLDNGYTISVASDVSELVEKSELLDASLTLGRSGIWTYDFRTKRYSLSKSLYGYFGKEKAKEITEGGFAQAIVAEDRPILREALKNIVSTNDKFDVELRCITGSGNVRWCSTTAEIVRDHRGRPLRLRAFVKDTEREHRQQLELENMRDEAIQASKAKSEFLANMSHEIRTPMNGILGMAELLAHSDIDDRQKEYVDVITNSASALLCIINDILDFSKIEAGALHLDPTPFDLKASINDVTSLLVANAQEKGLELIINYASNLPQHFIGDAGRIRQIMTNLIGNAIKFTSEGYVRIDVKVDDNGDADKPTVSLDVTDTGIGIAKDKLTAVFDKFTQADGSTTRVYGGTGLGLAITKRISEMMGGRVEVTSTVGEGSTFGVRIPLEIDRHAKVEKFDIAALSGRHALIIDDIDVNRMVLADQLKGWGMTSHAVENGIEAVEILKSAAETPGSRPYDVILLDYLMPGINGRELAGMLASQSSVEVPPIVMLSSCDQSVSSQELAAVGIESYLVKPVRERRLFDTLGRMLGKLPAQSLVKRPPLDQTVVAPAEPDTRPAAPLFELNPEMVTAKMPEVPAPVFETSAGAAPQTPQTPVEPSPDPIQAPAISPEPAAVTPTSPASRKQEILVAEDFPLNRDVVRLMLEETPFEPIFAENGKLASDLFMEDSHRFPLILMDVSMPVMDGFEATKRIRAFEASQPGHRTVPIIALTGHALKNDRQECLDAGMTHYLTKPVKQTELLEVLERYSGRAVDASQAA